MCPMIDTAMRRILNELPKSGRVSLCVSILTGRKKKIVDNFPLAALGSKV